MVHHDEAGRQCVDSVTHRCASRYAANIAYNVTLVNWLLTFNAAFKAGNSLLKQETATSVNIVITYKSSQLVEFLDT